MYLTGIADEAGVSIDVQIKATRELGWKYIEARVVEAPGFPKGNIHDIPDAAFDIVQSKLEATGIGVCCFGSGIMNWAKRVEDPFDLTLAEVRRAIPRMKKLSVKLVRSAGNVVRRMIYYLAGFIPFALLFAVVRWSLLPPWFPQTQQWGHRTFAALIALTHTTFGDELIFYIAVVIAAHAAIYFQRIQRQELEQLALKEALTQSELHTLQMQIQPHFLFNTLNGISSLVHSDAGRAEQMILRLSSLLRRTLKQDGSDLVRLAEELHLAEDYLDIEGMRLGNRMSVRWDIQPETRDLLVPQFMFQLLIENGVKHGVANSRGQGWIEITSRQSQEALKLEVKNSVSGETQQGMGVGHQNIRTRLSLLYGADARLMFDRKDKIAVATLVLPVFSSTNSEAKTVRQLEPEMRS